MRTKKQIEKEISKAEKEREEVFNNMRPLQDKASSLYQKLSDLRNELSELFAGEGKLKDIEFLINNYDPDKGSTVHHNALGEWASKYTLMHSGYVSKTRQPNFQVAIHKDGSNIEKTLEGLKLLLPHLKPISTGNLFIDIFDHELSEHYSYHMEVSPDFERAWVYNHYSDCKFEGKLEDTLKYIQKDLWYD
jgi:hypothetical protein